MTIKIWLPQLDPSIHNVRSFRNDWYHKIVMPFNIDNVTFWDNHDLYTPWFLFMAFLVLTNLDIYKFLLWFLYAPSRIYDCRPKACLLKGWQASYLDAVNEFHVKKLYHRIFHINSVVINPTKPPYDVYF